MCLGTTELREDLFFVTGQQSYQEVPILCIIHYKTLSQSLLVSFT